MENFESYLDFCKQFTLEHLDNRGEIWEDEDFCFEENLNESEYWESLFKHPHE